MLDKKLGSSTITEETTEDVVKSGFIEIRISTSSSWGLLEIGIIALAMQIIQYILNKTY